MCHMLSFCSAWDETQSFVYATLAVYLWQDIYIME